MYNFDEMYKELKDHQASLKEETVIKGGKKFKMKKNQCQNCEVLVDLKKVKNNKCPNCGRDFRWKSIGEAVDAKKIIDELISTSFGGDNESQMKAVQLLKGLATSDDPASNAFMKKLDNWTSSLKKSESDLEEQSTQMKCMECGHSFKKKIGAKTVEVRCPKCKGYDTEPA